MLGMSQVIKVLSGYKSLIFLNVKYTSFSFHLVLMCCGCVASGRYKVK